MKYLFQFVSVFWYLCSALQEKYHRVTSVVGIPYTFGSARYRGIPFSYLMKGIIYIATNLFNGRSYIGQTRCSLSNRIKQHFVDARRPESINEFHLALTQYGKDGFEWKVIDEFTGTKEEVIHALNVAEEYHILKNRTMLDENGYNATRGGYSSNKFADAIKRRSKVDCRYKAVLQYDLNGDFIREWESVSDVCRSLGYKNLNAYLVSKRPLRGYQWRVKESEAFPKKIDAYQKARRNSPVLAYTSDGNFYKEFESLNQCRVELDRQYNAREEISDISIPCHLKDNFIIFKKKKEEYPLKINVEIIYPRRARVAFEPTNIPVLQYSRDGVFMREFPSIIEAHRETGVTELSIRAWCKKPLPLVVRNSNVTYVWRYKRGVIEDKIEVVGKDRKGYAPKMEHRVVQYDLEGNLIKVWDSAYRASEETGEPIHRIRKMISEGVGVKKSLFRWKRYEEADIC